MVAVIAFSLFIDYFLYGILLPLTAHSPALLHTEEQMAWLYGAYAASVLLITPVFGYFGDRVEDRAIVLCGIVLAAVATVFFALGSSFYVLVVARLFQGAASAALWTAGLSLIAARYVEKRTEMIGYALAGSTAGSCLGPLAGGLLSHAWGYRRPFLLVGILLAFNAFLILVALPRHTAKRSEKPNFRKLLLDRAVIVSALAVTLAAFAVGIIEPLLPVRLAHDGIAPHTTGLIFTVSTLVYGLSASLVARASTAFPINKVMACGAAAMAATLPLLALFRQAGLLCIALALIYVAFAFMLNPASAEMGNAVDRAGMSCYSAVYALYNIVYSVGMLAIAGLAPVAARLLGFLGALLSVSAILLLCIPFLISMKARSSSDASNVLPAGSQSGISIR